MTRIPRGRLLNAALGIVLVAVVAAAWFTVGSTDDSTAVAARTTTVTTGSVTATVSGSGNLESARTSSLAFGASGTVESVSVKVGDAVKKGRTLARIDTASAQRQLASAKASLASADASYADLVAGRTSAEKEQDELSIESAELSVKSAQKQLTSARKSGKSDSVTQAEQSVAQAKVQLAQAEATAEQNAEGATAAQVAQARVSIASAQADVQDAQDALDATRIVAPFSGTILSVAGATGDSVTSGASSSSASGSTSESSGTTGASSTGSSSSTGTGSSGSTSAGSTSTDTSSTGSSSTFITMASLSSLDVTANIAEADIGSVKTGQDATVTLSATDEEMSGTVEEVSPEGTTSSNVVQYPVTIRVDDPVAAARLGASVSVTITTGSAQDALVLPTAAITTTGNRHTVTVLKNGVAGTQAIETGLVGGTTTQVTSGLTAGEVVRLPTTTAGTASTGVPGFGAGGTRLGGGTGGLGR